MQKETSLDREAAAHRGRLLEPAAPRACGCRPIPTVTYALKRDGKWTGTLYRSDYGYESPFNTYLVDGLPPGPICNPGADALRAAVAPARTEFLYFVADGTGGHTFSRTFQEHLDAIAAAQTAGARPAEDAEAAGGTPARPRPAVGALDHPSGGATIDATPR